LKIKIYKDDSTGKPKGDCRVAYENIESVQMALEMLNDSEIRPGFPIHIELA
jgi:RNA recognition motif-containing protein